MLRQNQRRRPRSLRACHPRRPPLQEPQEQVGQESEVLDPVESGRGDWRLRGRGWMSGTAGRVVIRWLEAPGTSFMVIAREVGDSEL